MSVRLPFWTSWKFTVEPSPADDLQVGKVGLPQLIDRGGLVFELTSSLHHDERRTGDQVGMPPFGGP